MTSRDKKKKVLKHPFQRKELMYLLCMYFFIMYYLVSLFLVLRILLLVQKQFYSYIINKQAVAYVNNNWIITKVLHKENNTYGVIDLYPDAGSNPEECFVNENQILFYIGLHPENALSTENYILPYGKRVLALWPESTTFYPAIVKGRTGIDV